GQGSVAASSLFTAHDPDGDPITQYDFWDRGAGGGQFVLNATAQPTNTDIYVSAAQLSLLAYQAGSSADTLWVRANDGTQWGAWSNIFTVTPPTNQPPVVSPPDALSIKGQGSVAASSLFTANDPDGDTIAQYDFWDTGAG